MTKAIVVNLLRFVAIGFLFASTTTGDNEILLWKYLAFSSMIGHFADWLSPLKIT